MCIHVRANADPDSSEFCSLRRLIYLAAVDLAQIAPAPLPFQSKRPPALGDPPLLQPRSVTSQNWASVWQFLHHWFRPVDSLPPDALALRPAALAFFRLRAAPYLVSQTEEAGFWQEFGQQFNAPHPLRHQLALYRCDADESEQARPRLTPLRRKMVKVSLGPAPVRVGCLDDSGYSWAWRWEDALDFEHGDFSDDAGPWAGCGETPPELAEEHMHELHEFYDYDGDLGLDDFG